MRLSSKGEFAVFDLSSLYNLRDGAIPDEGFVLPEVNDRNLEVQAVCFDDCTLYVEPYREDENEPAPPDLGMWVDPLDLVPA